MLRKISLGIKASSIEELDQKKHGPKCLLALSLTFSAILLLVTYNVLNELNSDIVKHLQPSPSKGTDEFQLQADLFRPRRPLHKNNGENTGPADFDLDFDEFLDDRILLQRDWIQNVSNSTIFNNLKPKKILVLDAYDYYYGNGQLNCPTSTGHSWDSKCILIPDNWWTGFFRDYEALDAVVGLRNWNYRFYEGKLPRVVKQILLTVESPFVTRLADVGVNNAFLASYWRGSDISMAYGKFIPFQNVTQNNQNQISESLNRNYAEGKTKLAAIVVSDCTPDNDRLGYVKELQLHMPVDIYGKCGTLRCEEPCFETLKKQYKFYLAFENANCRDYITEKLFRNALQYDMVPVVLGAHKKDYLYAAPPNSFIHVEDFQSPEHLASYLQELSQNDDLYNKFFEWKPTGYIIDPREDFFCRTCALLFMADLVQPPVWPKGSTWKELNTCLPPGRWYWNRTNS